MRHRKKNTANPQIDISFTKHNDKQIQEDNRLNIQMLRVHATEKQRVMKDIWQMDQQSLCEYFTNYRLFPQKYFTMQNLLDSNNLKLIKNDGKIYFGQVQRKKRSGVGICVYKQGKLYEGQFQDNERTGIGVEIYANGNLYVGDFLNNKKHNQGQFFWFNLIPKTGDRQTVQYYDGQWWGGLPDGQGLHQKINGDLYAGNFKNGLKHGLGTQNFGNGDYYKGEYVNGLPQGFGEYIWADGSFYKGDFKQGLRSGYGVWCLSQTENCQRYQGHYCMDKKSGYGVYQWQNGWTYKGNFDNDYRNGYGELYDRSKCVYRGFWDNGQQTENQKINSGKFTAHTSHSAQMSRVSGFKNSDMNQNQFYTLDPSQVPQRYKIEPKLSLRPQFTIKKRPQSYSNLQKSQIKKRHSSTAKKSTNNDFYQTIGTSLSRPIMKNHLYVPGMNTQRLRR